MTAASTAPAPIARAQAFANQVGGRLLGRDTRGDLAVVVAVFIAYLVLDRLTGQLARVDEADLGRASLAVAAIGDRWWLALALIAVAAAGLVGRRDAMLLAWGDLEHGTALRVGAGCIAGLLAWQSALYELNFVAGRLHGGDRLLVVALFAAVLWRPVAIVPFVLQVRIVNEQFIHPFGTTAAKNVAELLLTALLAIAATHVVAVITGRRETSSTVLLVTAAIGAHFFLPGRGKLAGDWLRINELAELPLSSHTAGWLGHTDGAVARAMADFFTTFRLPVLIATLVIELGVIVGVLHPKLFRFWLVSFVVFHVMTFVTTGFFFLGWTLLELGMLVALAAPRFRSWVAANATPARGLLAAAAVVGATTLFHPPGLAWYDAPVSYGYQLDATGVSGQRYNVPLTALGPYTQDLSFIRPQLADRPTATAGYGAITTIDELDQLRAIDDFAALEAYERSLGGPPPAERSQAFLLAYFDHVNRGDHRSWLGLGPPTRYWNSREEPVFSFDEPLARLEVFLVAAIHRDDGVITERRPVLTIEAGEDGLGRVAAAPTP